MKAYGRQKNHVPDRPRGARREPAKEWRKVTPYMAPRPKRTDTYGRMRSELSDADVDHMIRFDPTPTEDV